MNYRDKKSTDNVPVQALPHKSFVDGYAHTIGLSAP